ncbi:MAG: inositol monophosphatase family protein [Candidatus Hodgkinia cicadicola]
MITKTQKLYFKIIDLILQTAANLTKKIDSLNKLNYHSKSNFKFDPVTWYDKIIESNVIDIIGTIMPEANIYGEEFGYLQKTNESKNLWIIDPIDGTKSFLCGSAIWGTILTYINNGNISIGALDFPVLNERLIGAFGSTYTKRGNRYDLMPKLTKQVEEINLKECVIASSTVKSMSIVDKIAFKNLEGNVLHVIKDCDCYSFSLLARGRIDAIVECALKPQDILGLIPIAEGVGCVTSDWRGERVCFGKRIVVARNEEILIKIVAKLGPYLI